MQDNTVTFRLSAEEVVGWLGLVWYGFLFVRSGVFIFVCLVCLVLFFLPEVDYFAGKKNKYRDVIERNTKG